GMEMLAGGALLLLAALVRGEWSHLDTGQVSMRSFLGFVYLIVFGALVGFTAYLWILRATTPARASTYAFVNPLVAVFLGWLLANEAITARTLVAAAVIVTAVVLIVTSPSRTSLPAGSAAFRPRSRLA